MCLSGYTAFDAENAGKIISEANKEVPVLVCHGKMDQVVDFKAGVHLCEKLKINGIPAEGVKAYPNMGHSSCPAEMRDVQAFISKILK